MHLRSGGELRSNQLSFSTLKAGLVVYPPSSGGWIGHFKWIVRSQREREV
jgi:hypothetical protein